MVNSGEVVLVEIVTDVPDPDISLPNKLDADVNIPVCCVGEIDCARSSEFNGMGCGESDGGGGPGRPVGDDDNPREEDGSGDTDGVVVKEVDSSCETINSASSIVVGIFCKAAGADALDSSLSRGRDVERRNAISCFKESKCGSRSSPSSEPLALT